MGSSDTRAPRTASPEFRAVFRAQADSDGTMPFERFMALALYHPEVGYYRQPRARIGYGPGTDFFTASTSGPIFGELICAACVTLLGGRNPRDFTFVEVGAEPDGGVLRGMTHPFGAARTIRLGEPIALEGPCVVFSNELFDAQPFQRFVYRKNWWQKLGVALRGDELLEVEIGPADDDALPRRGTEGYVFDAPFEATNFAGRLAMQPWTGLFVACDYGKSWRELSADTPAGTARAYFRHTQSNDLLARPGEQDLTCHICWDWLADTLACHRFITPVVEAQEAFFVRHAAAALSAITAAEAGRFSPRKQSLQQLLQPAHLGRKFQVLHASRG